MLTYLARVRAVAWAGLLVGVLACGGSDDTGVPTNGTLVIAPSSAQLFVDNGAPATQAFTVTLIDDAGRESDVTGQVGWQLVDPAFGSFAGATFTARGGRAGKTMAQASLGPLTGQAQIEVTVRGRRVIAGAPANAPDLFASATDDPAVAPVMVYPPDRVVVPGNLGDFEAHWTDAHGHDLYEVRLEGDHVDLRAYTTGGATGWTAFTPSEWDAAARSSAQLTLGLRGLTLANPGRAGVAPNQIVTHGIEDVEGGLYYWAAESADASTPAGIFRYDFGAVGQPAEEFYTTRQSANGRCVACHTLSRDGTKMALTYDGGNQSATIVDVATRTPAIAPSTEYWNFAAYTPDGAKLITSHNGVLTVRDGTTGAAQGTVPTGAYATHPDFAPDGTTLVYVQVAAPGADWHFGGGAIMAVSYDAATGAWGAPRVVVEGGGNNYYPSVSPDGQWVLFNRSGEDAYDDASAELWVARLDGSQPPRKLDLANIGVGLTNSWARWAPFRNTYSDGVNTEDLYWITFSSKRAFGVRLGAGRPQIWMAAFFPRRAAAGNDPTGPAFRLPFQALVTSNHIAQWTETVVPIGRTPPR
jgi:hypothetical protein